MLLQEVYDMRHSKMAEWMENVEKVIKQLITANWYIQNRSFKNIIIN